MKNLKVGIEYTGAVWLENTDNGDATPLQLALSDEYRGKEYPVEQLNGALTVVFPFGRYYLSKRELDAVGF